MPHPSGVVYPVHAKAINYSPPADISDLSVVLSQEFSIQANDTLPLLDCLIVDANDDVVDLSAASAVLFEMTPVSNMTAPRPTKVSAAATLETDIPVTQRDGTSIIYPHVVRYSWDTADTDTPMTYDAHFQVTFDDDSILSARLHVQVIPELAE